jgi:hypothetical protein
MGPDGDLHSSRVGSGAFLANCSRYALPSTLSARLVPSAKMTTGSIAPSGTIPASSMVFPFGSVGEQSSLSVAFSPRIALAEKQPLSVLRPRSCERVKRRQRYAAERYSDQRETDRDRALREDASKPVHDTPPLSTCLAPPRLHTVHGFDVRVPVDGLLKRIVVSYMTGQLPRFGVVTHQIPTGTLRRDARRSVRECCVEVIELFLSDERYGRHDILDRPRIVILLLGSMPSAGRHRRARSRVLQAPCPTRTSATSPTSGADCAAPTGPQSWLGRATRPRRSPSGDHPLGATTRYAEGERTLALSWFRVFAGLDNDP